MDTPEGLLSPPLPRLVLRIGVTGHRPNRLGAEVVGPIETQCRQVIADIKDILTGFRMENYSSQPGLMRIVSSLAEGSDRMVAEIGLELGAELQCPLPFPVEEYERDFQSDASRAQFRKLLNSASAVLQQDGNRADSAAAYESAGRTMLHHSDLLIAIWDGEAGAGRGGTAQMVHEAVAQGVPTIWIYSAEHATAYLIVSEDQKEELSRERLASVLRQRLLPPGSGTGHARRYFAECHPGFNTGQFFRMFRDFVAHGKLPLTGWRIKPFVESTLADWSDALSKRPEFSDEAKAYILDRVCPHFAWADGLSNYYAGCFRSSSLGVNLMGAFAVVFALIGVLFAEFGRELGKIPTAIEFALILAILAVTFQGRRRRWHEKWLNYRQLAEQLRQISFLGPLGFAIPSPHSPAHLGDDPHAPWIASVARAIERDIGLVHASATPHYVASVGGWLDGFIDGQIRYHRHNAETAEKLEHRLHLVSTVLFLATMGICIMHLLTHESAWMLFGAAVFPALGAALYGISSQGELARVAKRSQAMQRELASVKKNHLEPVLQGDAMNMNSLGVVADRVAEVMIGETVDWLFVFRLRSLTLPG